MTEIKISVELQETLDKIDALLHRLERPEPVLHIIGRYMVEMIRKNIRTEGRGEWDKSKLAQARGGQTLRQTGRLYNSFDYNIEDGNRLDVGTNLMYARMMREGGEIRPRNAKFLTIPVHKLSYRKRASDFAGRTRVELYPSGKGMIFLKRERAEDIPLFALVKKVTIPGWDYMKIYQEDIDRISKIVARYVTSGEI